MRSRLDENVSRTYNLRPPQSYVIGTSRMPEIVADPPAAACSLLNFESGIQELQPLGSDPLAPRARDRQPAAKVRLLAPCFHPVSSIRPPASLQKRPCWAVSAAITKYLILRTLSPIFWPQARAKNDFHPVIPVRTGWAAFQEFAPRGGLCHNRATIAEHRGGLP
jgi:hypothetical protein